MENIPAYVSVVFMITTFVTAGIFLSAVRAGGATGLITKLLVFLTAFWLLFQYFAAAGGFYANTASLPPRLFVFGVLPALLLIGGLFVFSRSSLISTLSIAPLTLLHAVRIPVELTLSWLAAAGAVPALMTYHGTNFDILSGLTAPIAFFLATRKTLTAQRILTAWNVAALILLLNVVITAILCVPSPIQRFAFDRPNVAVLHAPYIWLPVFIVPVVLFCHLASLYQLLRRRPA